MKRIRVPAEMLKAAWDGYESQANLRYSVRADALELAVEAVLRYISEHPHAPTDEQAREVLKNFGYGTNDWDAPFAKQYMEAAKKSLIEWQRRCFQEEEPSIVEVDASIPDLLFPSSTHVVISEANRHIREAYRRGLRKGGQR